MAADISSRSKIEDIKNIIFSYSRNKWSKLLSLCSSLIYSFHIKGSARIRTVYRRRGACLPLPLADSLISFDYPTVPAVLEDVLDNIFLILHQVHNNMQFWQSRAEGSNAQKIYFMIFERGPFAFIDGTMKFVQEFAKGSSGKILSQSASSHIFERISILTRLRYSVAIFLAQIYSEVDKFGADAVISSEKSLCCFVKAINILFTHLEASICHLASHGQGNGDSYSTEDCTCSLHFEKLPEESFDGPDWKNSDIDEVIHLIYENIHRLENFTSFIIRVYGKPSNSTLYWFHYTCGVIGISVCSTWLLRHSRIMGSSDIDNWIRDTKDLTSCFWNDHVHQPMMSIRNELFETFKKRHKGVMEFEEVQLTANSLHRMLLAFSEQTKGQKIPEGLTDQEMLEIVMGRYEKELMHPIQNLVGGELVRALLIQVQKLKLDIETAMLELDQILKANEINFAVLAALPAFFLSLVFLVLVRAWIKQDTRAEGRGRVARIQRRLLVVEIERKIMQYQAYLDQGLEDDAHCTLGLALYSLDRLYRVVERHAKATGEWTCLKEDILDIAKPGPTTRKLIVASRMQHYDCLLPLSKHQ